jgi:hypothetical protein
MKFHITVRNWWLLAACGVLAGGAVWFIVLDDWRHGAELSADHGMFFLLFFASLLSGLFIGPAARAKKFGTALVLSIVTLASAFLLVAESAGRVAKVSFTAEALANKDEGVMKDALADLKKARAALSDANANFAKECGTGRGLRCAGLKEAVNALEMQFYKAQTRLDSLKPAAPSQWHGRLLHGRGGRHRLCRQRSLGAGLCPRLALGSGVYVRCLHPRTAPSRSRGGIEDAKRCNANRWRDQEASRTEGA